MSDSWHSYPKVYALGHAAIRDIFLDPVVVQEKVDGSQFSFGVFDGELRCRSKGKNQYPSIDRLFEIAVDQISKLNLKDGWTYSGEYLSRPKHNTIKYNRIPDNNIVIFDIRTNLECYLGPESVLRECDQIGLEMVPTFHNSISIRSVEEILDLMEKESFLGGSKVEGLVFKNYGRFSKDGKALMGKYVSESFKEMNQKDFRNRNPQNQDLIQMIGDSYRTEARWNKAIFRLRDNGELTNEPKDIGKLIKAIQDDVSEECGDEIKEKLFKWAWRQIERKVVAGFPEYYKKKLMESQFDEEE